MRKPSIEGSDGEIRSEYSDGCVECMQSEITKEVGTVADFDESGWFFPIFFACQNAKCKHKWTEKFRVAQ